MLGNPPTPSFYTSPFFPPRDTHWYGSQVQRIQGRIHSGTSSPRPHRFLHCSCKEMWEQWGYWLKDTFTPVIDIILPTYMRGRGKAGKTGEEKTWTKRDVRVPHCVYQYQHLSDANPPSGSLLGSPPPTPAPTPKSLAPRSAMKKGKRTEWTGRKRACPSPPPLTAGGALLGPSALLWSPLKPAQGLLSCRI